MGSTLPPIDAHLARNFRVRIGDEEIGLAAVAPLSVAAHEGAQRPTVAVLRRGVDGSTALWDWFTASLDRDAPNVDVRVELTDGSRAEVVAHWILRGARPSRWTGPALDALGTEVAMEELEVTYQELEWLREG